MTDAQIVEATTLYRELRNAGYSADAAAQIVDEAFGLTEATQ